MAGKQQVIKDWVLQLGFDTSLVDRGGNKVKKLLASIENMENKAQGKRTRAATDTLRQERRVTVERKKQLNILKEENTLEGRKLTLKRSMGRAKDLGIETKGYHNTLRAKNPDKVRQRTLELDNQILAKQREMKQATAATGKEQVTNSLETLRLEKQKTAELKRQESLKARRTNFHSRIDSLERGANRHLPGSDMRILAKPLNDLRVGAEAATTSAEFANLNRKLRSTTEQTREYIRVAKQQARALNKQKFAADGFNTSLKHMARSYISVFALMAGGNMIFQVGKQMDAMQASLLSTADSAEEAKDNFKFLKAAANDLGKDTLVMTRGFNRIAVAARGAGFSTEQAKEIFLAAAEASNTYQLDAQRTNLVMLAMSQIMAKGRVSMEELSRQLGENLPIAMQAAAEATGKSSSELIKLIESGKLLPGEFMMPFAKSIRRLARENGALAASKDKLIAKQERFLNTLKEGVHTLFQNAGAAEALGNIFGLLTNIVKGLGPPIFIIVAAISGVINAISAVLGPVNQLIADLGVPGGGLGLVVMFLANVALVKLIKALLASTSAMRVTAASFLTGGRVFAGIGLKSILAKNGIDKVTRSLLLARWAVRAFKAALGPIGWLLLGAEAIGSIMANRQTTMVDSQKYRNFSERSLQINANINLQGGNNDQETARVVHREMQLLLNTNF